MQAIKTIGYPFIHSNAGLFNPVTSVTQNAKGKLLNLLYTKKGQRMLANNCQFGMNIEKYIFQNIGYSDMSSMVSKEISKQIMGWIPEISSVDIVVQQVQKGSYSLTINFKVNGILDTLYLELNMNE